MKSRLIKWKSIKHKRTLASVKYGKGLGIKKTAEPLPWSDGWNRLTDKWNGHFIN